MTTLIQIAPALIAPSLTNPRKTFDQVKLNELAESIKASGLHSPVLLRPLPASRLDDTFRNRGDSSPLPTHELVTGERRLRASVMAEQAEIPAIVRDLTDAEALEIQVIENLQRDDLAALEEAEGYEHLMQHSNLNADQVAAKIGKSRSYVYARLKLLDLCQEGRQAVREGKLDASKALMVARVPTHKLQLRAIEALTETNHQGDTMSARAASTWLRNNLMLRLDTAVFDIKDAKLCPEAGSCMQCPKRTGANPELFSDVDSADVCTDTTCFHDKIEAHTEQVVAKAKKRGLEVIEGEEAKAIKPHPGTWMRGYTALDERINSDVEGDSTLRQHIKPAELKGNVKLLIDPHTRQPVEVVPDDLANKVHQRVQAASAKAAGTKGGKAEKAQTAKDREREQREKRDELEKQYQKSWRDRAVQQIEPQVQSGGLDRFEPNMLRAVLFHLVCTENPPDGHQLGAMIGVEGVDWYDPAEALPALAKADDFTLGANLIVLLLRNELHAGYTWNNGVREYDQHAPMIEACAERLGIDLAEIREQVKADMRAELAEFAEIEEPSQPLPSAAPATASAASKPKKGAKTKAAPAKKLSAAEAEQGIAAAMQGEEAAADDGRGEQDGSETAGDLAQAWPFPKTKGSPVSGAQA